MGICASSALLKPPLANKYRGLDLVIIDPAAFQRVQTDERCVADIFKTEGFSVRPAATKRRRFASGACGQLHDTRGGQPCAVYRSTTCSSRRWPGSTAGQDQTKGGDRRDKPEKTTRGRTSRTRSSTCALHADGGAVRWLGDKPATRNQTRRLRLDVTQTKRATPQTPCWSPPNLL